MAKKWKKVAAVAVTAVMAVAVASSMAACKSKGNYDIKKRENTGWKDEKEYTYNSWTTAIPSLWNELASTDGGDRDIYGYLGSSFFEFDFKFDKKGEIVPGEFTIVSEAATKLEDVTAQYKGKYGIEADNTEGHRAWKYTLRNDLKWDDGTKIVAGDFVYTMEKQLNGKYMFEQAANQWNGNYILHNAKEYFYAGVEGYYAVTDVYPTFDEKIFDKIYFSLGNAAENEGYDGTICYMRDAMGFPAAWTAKQVASYLVNYGINKKAECTVDEILALEGKTYAEIKADAALSATWTQVVGTWQTDPGEERDFFVCYYKYADVSFDEVGIFAPSDTELVIVYDNANLAPINEDGSLSYEAAYYFSGLPLVKKDLWEANDVAPVTGSTVWTNNYNSPNAKDGKSASWGPYKLTNYQAGTTYTLSRNENWYGYNMPEHEFQYQTDKIVVRQIPEWNTAWQAFQKGELNGIGIDVTIADEYRNSERAYYTPTSGVSTYFLQCNADALTKEKGNAILAYKDFRQAFSLALNREQWCQTLTTSYVPALGIYNDLIYYDVANGGVYRYDDAAKEVLLQTYGAEKQSNGKWKVGKKTYSKIDDALNALTGYNLSLAKELFDKAYDAAVADGVLDADGTVTIRFGATEENESTKRTINFLNDMFATATEGTKLEGKVKVVYFEMNSASWIDDFRKGGQFDICSAYVSGGAWNPYYSLQIYLLDAQRLTLGWNTSAEKLTLTVKGGEGQQDVTDTLSLVEWFNCLNGLTGCKYNLALYPTTSRLAVTAALEGAILQSYTSLPIGSMTSSSLMSYRCDYITYEYNTFMGFGGIQYLTYHFDDTEWANFVAEQGGTLNYKG